MRYRNNGLELEYRDCQILREVTRFFLNEDDEGKKKSLINQKDEFTYCFDIVEGIKSKRERSKLIYQFLTQMDEVCYLSLCEYILELAEPNSKIEIMEPYISTAGIVILPVNVHEYHGTYSSEELNGDSGLF